MLLYHGSNIILDKPVYGKGKPYNDYGRGLYCTEDIDLAREWAVDEDRDGFVNRYELDINGLKVIDLNSGSYCILHWITVLLVNRRFELTTPLALESSRYLTENYSVDVSSSDIIKGFRADDSYFSYAQDFINGVISVSQLNKAMHLGNLGEQIMIRSRKAFAALEFNGFEEAAAGEWYAGKLKRDRLAREAYFAMNKDGYVKGDLYMPRIIDEEIKGDDPRLQ